MKNLREKEYYRERIVEMVRGVEKLSILNYIYIIVLDVAKEDKGNVKN